MIDESICDWILKNDNEIQKLRDKNRMILVFFTDVTQTDVTNR